MTYSRRGFLVATGLLTSPLAAGCVERQVDDSTKQVDDSTATTDTPGPTQGRADALRIEKTVTADKYEYVASNSTVRYPAATSGGEVVRYGYADFDHWVNVEGLSRGARAVSDRLASQLDGETTGLATGVGAENDDLQVSVSYRTHLDRDGNVISEPSVPFEQVVAATPRRVAVTLHISGHTGRASSPVTVRRATIRNA